MSSKDLDERIAKARAANLGPQPDRQESSPDTANDLAMSFGLRGGMEFVSAVIAGGALGWVIDRWLGTSPFGLLLLLLAGFAVALMNVWRQMGGGSKTLGAGQEIPPIEKKDTEEVDGESS